MRLHSGTKAIALLCLFCYLSRASYAQYYKTEVGAVADNDVYISYMQDRYYTNGLQVFFRRALKSRAIGGEDTVRGRYEKRILEIEAGQKIYNPYSSNAGDANLHDRPFTGYVYAGASMNLFYKNEDAIKIKGQLGLMGPGALGQQTQSAFHRFFGMHPVSGWEYQLKEEPAVNMQVIYDRMVYRSTKGYFDITGRTTILLGNTESGANAGMLLRIGYFNRLYQSVSNSSRILNSKDADGSGQHSTSSRLKPEIFVFTRPQLNYVVYNATIQGPLLRHDKGPVTFASKKLVYSQQVGVDMALNRWSGRYMVTFLSKEVKSTATASYYGSIALGYSF